jgi:hypothetical protein
MPAAGLPGASIVSAVQQLVQQAQVGPRRPQRSGCRCFSSSAEQFRAAQAVARCLADRCCACLPRKCTTDPSAPRRGRLERGRLDRHHPQPQHDDRSDASSPTKNIAWCPGEPNDRFSNEDCTVVLTVCTGGASAAVNDFSCEKASRCVRICQHVAWQKAQGRGVPAATNVVTGWLFASQGDVRHPAGQLLLCWRHRRQRGQCRWQLGRLQRQRRTAGMGAVLRQRRRLRQQPHCGDAPYSAIPAQLATHARGTVSITHRLHLSNTALVYLLCQIGWRVAAMPCLAGLSCRRVVLHAWRQRRRRRRRR